jgi:formamidopyrimidine-DNA glycosylase
LGLIYSTQPNLIDQNFIEKLDKYPKKTLPEILMDQKMFSGIGNYIKSECLYRAKLNPHRTVNSISHLRKKKNY